MATSSYESVTGLKSEKIIVGPGATLAQFIGVISGQIDVMVKYGTGGSLEVVGATTNRALNDNTQIAIGTTYTAAQLGTIGTGAGYLMGTSEVITIKGNARFYLMATGATVTAYMIRTLSQGW